MPIDHSKHAADVDNYSKRSGHQVKYHSGGEVKDYDEKFNTRLTPKEEKSFSEWKSKNAPKDSGEDYDLRGAFKEGLEKDTKSGHWSDKFKKPNHPTFSDQSKYAKEAPEKAGHWNDDEYMPARKR